jgi:hypothetical protein
MTRSERFLLYQASKGQRIALLLVLLFLEGLEAAAISEKRERLYVRVTDMHNHFPQFVDGILEGGAGWDEALSECFGLTIKQGEECPAVNLYLHLGEKWPNKKVSWVYMSYLHNATETEQRAAVEEIINALPTLKDRLSYELLVKDGLHTLHKMEKRPRAL